MNLPMFCRLTFSQILDKVLEGMPDDSEKEYIQAWFDGASKNRPDNQAGFLDAESAFQKLHTVKAIRKDKQVPTARKLSEEEQTKRYRGHWLEVACSDRLRKENGFSAINWV
jgi:hypothetical protein